MNLREYRRRKIDGSWIGLEAGAGTTYFCTPVGAEIIGWDNGIHYCFIKGFGGTVFCVNPETCCDHYVYPIARSLDDFLGLIRAVGHTNVLQQIIGWDREAFDAFAARPEERAYRARPEVQAALHTLGVAVIEDPFAYVKALQRDFPYEKLRFTDAYYDTLGLARPDGTAPETRGFEFRTVECRVEHNE